MQEIFQAINDYAEKYIDFLCEICSFEAKALDKQTIDKMVDYISSFAKAEGFGVARTAMERCGDFLSVNINEGAPKGCVFLAHTDTVHEKGAFGANPVTRLADRIIAPGAIDCKSGIAIALLIMKALKQSGYKKHLRLLLTSDEEMSNMLGGQAEIDYFNDNCAGFPYAVNCETSEKDEVVVSRKGILRYQIHIRGVGGHSGIHYFQCRNAIAEAAHKIIALESKSRPDSITYSCNMIQGGQRINIVPDHCSVSVDIRVPRHADMAAADAALRQIAATSFIEGTSATVECISRRPPMEKNQQTMEFFDGLLSVCRRYGLGSLTPVESGGGSDSCYTQAAGIASICGMGGCGEFCHTDKEYVLTQSIPLRAKILSAFLKEQS
ncbi:MAG: M20/M25/M40 family metallo-hydrolase [Oscillospiraceae bacterium]|nr:M20/M25/M40 family metallo-hydrolase [Oscillospiraceae bacterium]